MLLKSCGTVLPSSVTSRGSKMTVVFHTDLSVVRRGFRATWAEVTGGGATEVSCGGHTAASCAECGPWYWCNGDCAWSDGKCRDIVSSFLTRRFSPLSHIYSRSPRSAVEATMLPPALSVAPTGPTVMETVSGMTANVQIEVVPK